MKKLIPFTMLFFFALVLKNEDGSCKSNSQVCPKSKAVTKTKTVTKPKPVTKTKPATNTAPQVDTDYLGFKPYDGFFFKI